MNTISTHVLDTTLGRPAVGLAVTLEGQDAGGVWRRIGGGATNRDGRIPELIPGGVPAVPGTYRLTFETGEYFRSARSAGFYPCVQVVFELREPAPHLHIPLLLSPYGYTTYRGS
jgi:5-hydroxyisourate hydrolase